MKEKSVVLFPNAHIRKTKNSYCRECLRPFIRIRKRQTKCHLCCDISKLKPLIAQKKVLTDKQKAYKEWSIKNSKDRKEYRRLWNKNKNSPCKD